MVVESILQRLEAEFDSPPDAIRAVAELVSAGGSPEFITLFRRDETGDLGEERVAAISERLRTLEEVEQRRTLLLERAREHGRADLAELEELLGGVVEQDVLDDVDHLLRPLEGRAETRVRELGLGELLDALLAHELGEQSPRQFAERFVRDEDGLRSTDEVLAQAVFALSERFGDDPRLRQRIRAELARGILEASARAVEPRGAQQPHAPEQHPSDERASHELPSDEHPSDGHPSDGHTDDAGETVALDEAAALDEPSDAGAVAPLADGPVAPESGESEVTADAAEPTVVEDDASARPVDAPPGGAGGDGGGGGDVAEDEPAHPGAEASPETPPADATRESSGGEAHQDDSPGGDSHGGDSHGGDSHGGDSHGGDSHGGDSHGGDSLDGDAQDGDADADAGDTAGDGDGGVDEHAGGVETPAHQRGPRDSSARRRGKREGKQRPQPVDRRYADLVGLEEPVRRIAAPRMLALRRAEREGILQLRLKLEPGRELTVFRQRFSPGVDADSDLGRFLDVAYGHAYDHRVHRVSEQIVRHRIKEKADRETVRAFSRTLRSQLMAPTLLGESCAALRVSGHSAWFVTLKPDGAPKQKLTLPVPDDEAGRAQLVEALRETIRSDAPRAIAIPHGRRERAAAKLLAQAIDGLDGERPMVVPVDETASIVWATSASARKRHGSSDNGLRTTLSLARRLRDPLTELIRVEPRGLGLGQNLTEVHQGLLGRQLEATASSCLAHIGVELNRADQALLARLPGVSNSLARAIVQHRSQHGPFKTIESLKEVPEVDDNTFIQIAGFLRILDGEDPLDATAVHPEDYDLARRIASHLGITPAELVGHSIPRLTARDLGASDEELGPLRLIDVAQALRRGTIDPRGRIEPFVNEGVARFEDLSLDRELRGRVSNMAEFGAFVDLGIGQDGLIHLSQIPGSRLRDPARILRVGEIVTVYVVHLDDKGRKIGLSMFRPRHVAEGRPATLGERMGGGGGGGGGRGRGRRGDQQQGNVMSRAARAPEGRRGTTRRGPRPKPQGGDERRGPPVGAGGDERRGRGGPRDRGPGPGPGGGGTPRVMTFESERQEREVRGHKGELRSLSNLRALLGGRTEEPPASEQPKDGGEHGGEHSGERPDGGES
ncbi:MAG: helix-hairpin-helix domain-containing protein [Planctomycetes bacterium]|nr:helix-hairpin-helix domain-containing protein [Planctomycetota bacterium]